MMMMAADDSDQSRWKGVLQQGAGSCCSSSSSADGRSGRVTASLCLSPSTADPLLTPSSNVIFFVGDRVEGTDNPAIERLSRPDAIAAILVSKLGPSVNVWVVEPSHYQGSSLACYDNLLPSLLTPSGDPLGGYDPHGLPAARAALSLLHNCLAQVRAELMPSQRRDRVARGERPTKGRTDNPSGGDRGWGFPAEASPPCGPKKKCPRTVLLGFSKGGVVLNQLLAELTHLEDLLAGGGKAPAKRPETSVGQGALRQTQTGDSTGEESGSGLLPGTVEEFLRSVEEVHYVDVGLNCPGAYQTDAHVLDGLARVARSRLDAARGLLLAFHGTPRQWHDRRRRWVADEKDTCVALLRAAAAAAGPDPGSGKSLCVAEMLYFPRRRASLQMHFEIIEALIVSPCGGSRL